MNSPIPMLLWCPSCSARHVDEGEFSTKEHHTHACQSCGMVWRPAIVPTCGVQFLPGFKSLSTDTMGDRMIQLTRNFNLSELMCRDGTPVPDRYLDNARMICERAQVLRDLAGPLVVVSGFRSLNHNRMVRGAPKSMHLTASALDLRSAEHSASILHGAWLELIRNGKVPDGGLGLYRSWIHVDIGRPRRW